LTWVISIYMHGIYIYIYIYIYIMCDLFALNSVGSFVSDENLCKREAMYFPWDNFINKFWTCCFRILFQVNIIFFMWTDDIDLYLKSSNLVSVSKWSAEICQKVFRRSDSCIFFWNPTSRIYSPWRDVNWGHVSCCH